MKILVTGASGYIGTVVVEHAVRAGHAVEGLVRNQDGGGKGIAARRQAGSRGPAVVRCVGRGRLACRRRSASYIHDFSMDHSIVIDTDVKTVTALAEGAQGKPVITTSGTAVVAPAPNGGETDETGPINEGFVLMEQAAKHGVSAWVEGAVKRTSDVDVDDVARFYLAGAASAPAGSLYNCTGETDVTARQLAEAIGQALDVPSCALPRGEVETLWGAFLTGFVDYDNRASSAKAQQLGWRPQAKYGSLDDITTGSYSELARQLHARRTTCRK